MASEFQILLELVAGEKERSADRIKVAGVAIIGKEFLTESYPQQALDTVLVVALVESPHCDLATRVRQHPAGGHHRERQIIEEIRLLFVARLFGVFRRHLSGIQCAQHLLPEFCLLDSGDAEGQCFEIDFAFSRLRVVAIETVCFEECSVLFRKPCFRRRGLREGVKRESCNASCKYEASHDSICGFCGNPTRKRGTLVNTRFGP